MADKITETEDVATEAPSISLSQEALDSVVENEDGTLEIKKNDQTDEGNHEDGNAEDDQKKDENKKPDEGNSDDESGDDEGKGDDKKSGEDKVVDGKSDDESDDKVGDDDSQTGSEDDNNADDSKVVNLENDEEYVAQVEKIVKGILGDLNDPESRQKLLDDIPNWQKFMASNTQKSQEIAERSKAIDALADRLAAPDVVASVEGLKKIEKNDLENILNLSDDFFDSPKDNPFRMLVDSFTNAVPAAQEEVSGREEKSEREKTLDMREELIELQAIKDSPFDYNADKEVLETARIGERFNLPLPVAHRLRLADYQEEQMSLLGSKLKKLRSELKERNEELKKLKAVKPVPDKPVPSGKPGKRESYDKPPSDENEARDRMRKTWDEMMESDLNE